MAHIYWKGGNSSSVDNAVAAAAVNGKVKANWVYVDGTEISVKDFNNGDLSGHDIIFDYSKNYGALQTPRIDPAYLDMSTFSASAITLTWKSLTIKYNSTAEWCKILRWSGNSDTLQVRGLDIRKSKMLHATIATTIKFTGVPYFTSHRRNKGMGTVSGADTGDIYVRIVDEDDSDLSNYTFISKDIFTNAALGKSSYTAPGMFFDESSRDFFTFLFEPPNDTTLVLEDGIYPDMDFDCAGSDTATLSFDDVRFTPNTYTNNYAKVDMLKLTIDNSFNVKPTDHSLRNRKKYIQIREGYDLDCATFDMGYATLEIVPSATSGVSSYLPSNDTYFFGPTPSATQAVGMEVKYTKLVIGTPKKETSKLNLIENTVINCEQLVIKPGGRLYGPSYGDSNSAEIHCVKYPIIEGDWNFSQVAEGIYRASGTNQVLPASRGGTGLSTYGKQGQVLAVKSNGQGLEWSSTAGGGGVTVQEEGSSLATVATTINFTGSNVTASGTGTVKTIAIGDGGVVVQEEGSALSTTATTLNFVGSAVTATGTGATKTITITDNDTVYTHPTGDGNLHVPATGTSNNGKVLTAGSTAGSLSWVTPNYLTLGTTSTTALAGNTAVDNVSKANLITVMGTLNGDDTLNIGDADDDTTVVIRGNLQVDGTTTTIDSNTVNIGDNIIKLNADWASDTAPTQDAGIQVNRGSAAYKEFKWDETNDRWTVGSETMVAGTFVGALTGNASTAGSATTANYATIAAQANILDNNETDETVYLTFVDAEGGTNTMTGNNLETEGKLSYNPNSGLLTSTGFVGALTGNADTATSATSATTATKATNIAGGSVGVIPYQSAANTTALLAGNDTTTKKFLTQTGDGTDPAAPAWGTIAAADVPALAASKITSGTFDAARIPTLNQNTTGSAASATQVTVTDNESTDEANLITFVAGAASSTGLQDLEMDGDLTYNPSSGTLQTTRLKVADSLFRDDGANLKIIGNTQTQYQVDGQWGAHIFYTQNGVSGGGNNTEVFKINYLGNLTLASVNNRDKEIKVGDTADDAAGKALSIIAGSPEAGTTDNIAGGTLTLQGGQGKGTGAGGDIVFKVANAGTANQGGDSSFPLNSLATAMTIVDSGNVGIGDTTPHGKLEVHGTTRIDPTGTYAAVTGGGTDSSDTAAIATIGAANWYHESNGYLRNIIGHNNSGVITIGQGGTSMWNTIDLIPGHTGKIRLYSDDPGSGTQALTMTIDDKEVVSHGELRGNDNRQWTPNSYTLGIYDGNNANKWIKVCDWVMDGTNYDSFSFHAKVTQRGNATDWHDLIIRGEFATTWWTKDFNIHGPYASTAQDTYLMVFDHSSGGTAPKATLYYRNNNAWNKKYLQIVQNVRHGDNIPATSWNWYNTTTGATTTPTTDGETNSSTLSPDYYREMNIGLGSSGNDTQYRVYDGTAATALYLDTGDQRVGIGTGADVKSPLHLRDTSDGADQWSGIRINPATSQTSETDLNSYHRIFGFRKSGLSVSGGQSGTSAARSIITFNNSGLRFFTNEASDTDAAANLSTMKRFEIPPGSGPAVFSVPVDITTGAAGKLLELNDGNTSGTYMGICNTRAMVGYSSDGLTLQGGGSKKINFAVNNGTFGSGVVASFDTSGCLTIDNGATSGHSLKVYRNQSADNMDAALVYLHDDSQYSDEAVLHVKQDGTGVGVLVDGSLQATTKEFTIDHPTKPNMRLHHGSLEGPEHAVYVRGQHNASVITLPDYWEGLVDEDTITVQLTPIGEHQELFVKQIKNGKVRVASKKRNQMLKYFYFIQGERKDVEKLEVEECLE